MLEKDNTKVYVNGEFFLKKEASISVFDRGFLFSDSVYEVTAVIEGKLVDWQEHFARLMRSLDDLDIVNNFNEEDFYKIQKNRAELAMNAISHCRETSSQSGNLELRKTGNASGCHAQPGPIASVQAHRSWSSAACCWRRQRTQPGHRW